MRLRSGFELEIDTYSGSSKKPLESKMGTSRNKVLPQ